MASVLTARVARNFSSSAKVSKRTLPLSATGAGVCVVAHWILAGEEAAIKRDNGCLLDTWVRFFFPAHTDL